jgi:hypothetical protein
MYFYISVLNFLLCRDSHSQNRAVLDTFHLDTGNGGSLARVMEFPLNHQVGLPIAEQAASFHNITASNHIMHSSLTFKFQTCQIPDAACFNLEYYSKFTYSWEEADA